MESLFESYNLDRFKVEKPRKDDTRRQYIERLAEITSYSKRGLVFKFMGVPDSWLRDAINHCQHYSDVKARTHFLTEFLKEMKK